jgi:hypothetical protein
VYVESGSRSAGSKSTGGSSGSTNDTREEEDIELQVKTEKVVDLNEKHERLVDWNVDIVKKVLVQVVTRRMERSVKPTPECELRQLELLVQQDSVVLGAVKEIVSLPKYTKGEDRMLIKEVELSEQVVNQLRTYIVSIAKMYRLNPFHNFEVS